MDLEFGRNLFLSAIKEYFKNIFQILLFDQFDLWSKANSYQDCSKIKYKHEMMPKRFDENFYLPCPKPIFIRLKTFTDEKVKSLKPFKVIRKQTLK
jgi:hypothetical protein